MGITFCPQQKFSYCPNWRRGITQTIHPGFTVYRKKKKTEGKGRRGGVPPNMELPEGDFLVLWSIWKEGTALAPRVLANDEFWNLCA